MPRNLAFGVWNARGRPSLQLFKLVQPGAWGEERQRQLETPNVQPRVLEASEGFGSRHCPKGKTPAFVMNDSRRDFHAREGSSRFPSVNTLAEGEADRNPLDETGGTYSGA